MILPSITSFIPVILIRPNWLNDNAPLEETDNVWSENIKWNFQDASCEQQHRGTLSVSTGFSSIDS